MPLKTPFAAQDIFEQKFAGTTDFIQRAVVGAHHRFNLCFRDQFFEGRQVGIVQLTFGHNGIEGVTIFLRSRMDSIMFGTCRCFEIFGMIALQALHKRRCHLTGKERVFAPGFLSAPPARIAENIHIWRPEGQSLILIGISIAAQARHDIWRVLHR